MLSALRPPERALDGGDGRGAGGHRSRLRLLLRDAVERAAAREHRPRVDADGAAAREERSDALDRLVVPRRAVGRHDDRRVCDVEVHVARRHHPSARVEHAARRRDAHDIEPVRAVPRGSRRRAPRGSDRRRRAPPSPPPRPVARSARRCRRARRCGRSAARRRTRAPARRRAHPAATPRPSSRRPPRCGSGGGGTAGS